MAELFNVMAYIIENYPAHLRDELSNARLTKMVYLSDWRSALKNNRQLTSIEWYFDSFGPFVRNIEETVNERSDLFELEKTTNMYGGPKKIIRLKVNYDPPIDHTDKVVMDFVIEKTKSLYWDEFIKLVYSTYPIRMSDKYNTVDLVRLSQEYKNEN